MNVFMGVMGMLPLDPGPGRFRNRFEWSDAILKTLLFGQELVCIKAAYQRNMHYQPLRFVVSIMSHLYSQINGD